MNYKDVPSTKNVTTVKRNEKDFSNLTPERIAILEIYRTKQAENCALDQQSMNILLEANKVYGAMMDHIQPESWQTGLEDCMHFYTIGGKSTVPNSKSIGSEANVFNFNNPQIKWVSYRLGHDDHDRNSVRMYNTRFTLPMELKDLQGLSSMDYCLRYCILSTRRTGLYQRIFSKMKDNHQQTLNLSILMESIKSLLGGTLTSEQADELASLFELTPESRTLTMNEFYVLCAVAERLYYQKNLHSLTEETQQMLRSPIETADFYKLKSRINGVNIKPSLLRLLEKISKQEPFIFPKITISEDKPGGSD
ncbi:unnamed protein product [Heterobilharzia americana]|nr:unnamed protein product [Heterobilharzia americana]